MSAKAQDIELAGIGSPPISVAAAGSQQVRSRSRSTMKAALISSDDGAQASAAAADTCPSCTFQPNCARTKPTNWWLILSFWGIGVLNHTAYILMIACAKQIIEGGTALVFLANILPGLAIKTSAPYWFDAVPYETRIKMATLSMMTGYILVASTSNSRSHYQNQDGNGSSSVYSVILLCIQLLGVALANAQCALGEASLLALAGKVDAGLEDEERLAKKASCTCHPLEEAVEPAIPGATVSSTASTSSMDNKSGYCLTCLSSGTGMAGVFGFFWKWFWNNHLGLTLSQTLLLALSLGVGYWMTFCYIQSHAPITSSMETASVAVVSPPLLLPLQGHVEEIQVAGFSAASYQKMANTIHTEETASVSTHVSSDDSMEAIIPVPNMTSWQRFQLVLSLWPYMVPLFTVYAAEYAMQSGTWTAIGFPSVQDAEARSHFYQYSNWIYFVGSFLSRSSGVFYTTPVWVLWLLPALQVGNLIVFTHVAADPASSPFLYQPMVLYAGALFAGCLGGSVYISGYKRICADIPLVHREFALSTTSAAETFGIVVADVVGLVLQSCLYQVNGLGDSAMMSCPFSE